MTEILSEKISLKLFNELLIIEGRKHDNFQNSELDLIFSLIAEIEKYIHTAQEGSVNLSHWYVGITSNLDGRKTEHGNPKYWRAWDCKSDRIARPVEIYFTKMRGTQGDTGGGKECKFVYCYFKGSR